MNDAILEYFFEPSDLGPSYFELNLSAAGTEFNHSETRHFSPALVEEPIRSSAVPTGNLVPISEAPKTIASDATEPKTSATQPTSGSAAPRKSRTRLRQFLSVHALGQFVFCPRSAILAAEKGDQTDETPAMPRLTYLSNFDRERIEESLKSRLNQMGLGLIYVLIAFCVMVNGVLNQNRALFYPALLTFVGCNLWCLQQTIYIVRLAARRRAAIKAHAAEPIPTVAAIQYVNWWSLLKSGFEPVKYGRPFRHPELPLEGCPWRVLERDSLRIPVIRSTAKQLGDRKGTLYPKHQIRLVAYALLLEAMGHIKVPYGIVMPADSPHGYAMPITDPMRAETVTKLSAFARKLDESQQNQVSPSVPDQRKRCEKCPHGKPEAISVAEINAARKVGTNVVVLVSPRGETFHCGCGDRFGSVPPHRASIERGLMASLQ